MDVEFPRGHASQPDQLTQEQEKIGKQHIWDGWLSLE